MRMQLSVTSADLFHLAVLSGTIIALLLTSEALRRAFSLSDEFTRKVVHVGTGALILIALPHFPRSGAVVLIALLFVSANALAYARGWLKAVHHSTRRSFGTVYYPLALLLLAFPLWNTYPDIVVAAVMVMAIGDGAAGIVGEAARTPHRVPFSSDVKTLEGSAAMFAGSLAALIITILLYPDRGMQAGNAFAAAPMAMILALCAIALFATGWEAVSSRGLDNLSVPLAAALALQICFTGGEEHMLRFAAGAGLGLLVGIGAYRLRMLSASGAAATFLLATIVYGIGGWMWTLPLFVFFILSSLLSRWRRSGKQRFDTMFEKGGTRDAGQVAANGAIAGTLAVVWHFTGDSGWYLLSLVAVSVATADTWGTEIGVLSRALPRSILTGRRVPAGTSGGVTVAGTLGGMLGSAIVTASAFLFIDLDLSTYALIVGFGALGSAIDSVLGATLQAQYRCERCQSPTERRLHCDLEATLISGHRWITNDAVNLCSALASIILVILVHFLAF